MRIPGSFGEKSLAFLVTSKQPLVRAVAHTMASGSRSRDALRISTASDAISVDKGWMVKVKLSNPAEAASLLDAAGYKALIGK